MSNIFSISKMQSLEVKGTTRTYNLIIPPNLNQKSALIIALHGFSGNAKTIEKISQLSEYAVKENFFVAYPNGFGLPGNLVFSWNASFCCASAKIHNSDDVGFIKSLIDHLCANYPINLNKIFITGISNGAVMTHRLGIELGDMLAGIIPVAGAIGTVFPKPFQFNISQNPLDVIIFHGLKDTFIPFNGDKGVTENPNQFLPVRDQVKYWITVNKCHSEPIIETFYEGNLIKETYSSAITNRRVIFYLIKEGTHTWPGGIKGLTAAGEPVSKEICNTSQIITDFINSEYN